MQTAKQDALNAIQQLPDNADTEEMIYQLYVLENIRRGQQDAAEGKTQTAEEALKDIQTCEMDESRQIPGSSYP